MKLQQKNMNPQKRQKKTRKGVIVVLTGFALVAIFAFVAL